MKEVPIRLRVNGVEHELEVEHLEVGDDDVPLVHRRGRFLRPSGG